MFEEEEEGEGGWERGAVSIKGLNNSIALNQISHGQIYTNSGITNLGSRVTLPVRIS